MSVFAPVTVLGGLPVIAEVWFSGPDYYGEYDCGVDGLYWRKRDGTLGKALSDKLMERISAIDWWDADVTEQANDWLSISVPIRYSNGQEEGDYSPEYFALNPKPKSNTPCPL